MDERRRSSVRDAERRGRGGKLRGDAVMMTLYALAERRGCSVEAIDRMTASERNHWIAYYRIADEGRA